MSINALDKSISSVGPLGNNTNVGSTKVGDPGFKETLENQISGIDKSQSRIDAALKQKVESVKPMVLKFSNHAVERMNQRGIVFSPEQITRIENAARKAADKGSKETLIFADDSALIVNLRDKTVVTVMDKSALKENVFTKIDSTVVV